MNGMDAVQAVLTGVLVIFVLALAFMLVPVCGMLMEWFIESVLGRDMDDSIYWAGIGVLAIYALVIIGFKGGKED